MAPIQSSNSAHRLGSFPLKKTEQAEKTEKAEKAEAPKSALVEKLEKTEKAEKRPPEGSVVVREGDSLARIAQAVLGEAARWREIFELNRNQLNDPNLIYPGMLLKVPAEEPESPEKQETPEKQKASVEKAEQAEAIAKEENLGAKIAEGSRFLHERGYMYPPNLSSDYYHEPGKVGCCADFVCDSYAEAGFDLASGMREQGYNTAWCPDMLGYFQNHQQVISPEGKARVGDVVFFNWDDEPDPEHVGVVSEVDDQGRPTEVIESKSFGSPSVVTALSWDPPSGRASCIIGYGRLN